jgi:hypothetical protein
MKIHHDDGAVVFIFCLYKSMCENLSCHHILMQNHFVNMHLLCTLITILCVIQAKANEHKSEALWNVFKHVHKKHYVNVEEETYR